LASRRFAAILLAGRWKGAAMRKLILAVFATILIALGVFTVFSLVNNNIETMIGTLLVVASLVVVLWCFSLQQKVRLSWGTVVLVLVVVLLLSSTTMAYANVEPFVNAKDNLLAKSGSSDKSLISSVKGIVPAIPAPRPSGTFTAHKTGIKASATFRGDILEIDDEMTGRKVFVYQISEDGETIQCTNVITGEVTTLKFNYLMDYGIVIIDDVEYYRQ
jgi:hypothetical protein